MLKLLLSHAKIDIRARNPSKPAAFSTMFLTQVRRGREKGRDGGKKKRGKEKKKKKLKF